MDEQVRAAGVVANAISIPVIADGGAGFGEPLHVMRTVREFIGANVAGIHIEDQLYPKRAHYHKYVAHVIPREEFAAKIKYACRQRDESDPDFVIVARSDATRVDGFDEAVARLNMAADLGADFGLLFPRDAAELEMAPKRTRLPLIYAISRGNRDKRPLPSVRDMDQMGYKGCIDGLLGLLASFHFQKKALEELLATGNYAGLTAEECVEARHPIEMLGGLEEFYAIEAETVEQPAATA